MLSSDQISDSIIMIHIKNFKSYSRAMLSIQIQITKKAFCTTPKKHIMEE